MPTHSHSQRHLGRKLAREHSDHPHHHKFDFRRFWNAPSLHQDWHDLQEERKVTWTELFFDLFYVVACINLSHQIEANISIGGFGRFFFYFSFFWGIWWSYTVFQSRIRLIGYVFDFLSVLHMLGVLGMILHCNESSHFSRFMGCYAIVRLALATFNFVTAAAIPRARILCFLLASLYVVLAALGLTVAFVNRWKVFLGLGIPCILIEMFGPLTPYYIAGARLPIHVDHVNERFGLIMMIFLGETVVSLGKSTLTFEANQYAAIAFAAVVVYNFHLLYYHTSPDQHSHALRLSGRRGLTWTYVHLLVGAAFLMLGAAIRICVASYVPPSPSSAPHRRILLAAAAADHHPPASPPVPHAPDATHTPTPASSQAPTSDPYTPTTAAPHAYTTAAGATHGSFHAGDIKLEVAWLLCISYGLAMHLIGVIRCTHYLFNHIMVQAGKDLGVRYWMQAWWALVAIAPCLVYWMPLTDLSAVALLGYLAAHGTAYNAAETFITHHISSLDWTEAIHNAVNSIRAMGGEVPGDVAGEEAAVLEKGTLPGVVGRADVNGHTDHEAPADDGEGVGIGW